MLRNSKGGTRLRCSPFPRVAYNFGVKSARLRPRFFRFFAARKFHGVDVFILFHAGTGGDQLAEDHVFFQTDQRVYLVFNSRLGQHARRFLEGRRRKETVGSERRLGDAQKRVFGRAGTSVIFERLGIGLFEHAQIDEFAGEKVGVAAVLHFYLFKHLPHDHFDVLVVYLHALAAIHRLYFFEDILLHIATPFGAQNILRVDRAFG